MEGLADGGEYKSAPSPVARVRHPENPMRKLRRCERVGHPPSRLRVESVLRNILNQRSNRFLVSVKRLIVDLWMSVVDLVFSLLYAVERLAEM